MAFVSPDTFLTSDRLEPAVFFYSLELILRLIESKKILWCWNLCNQTWWVFNVFSMNSVVIWN